MVINNYVTSLDNNRTVINDGLKVMDFGGDATHYYLSKMDYEANI